MHPVTLCLWIFAGVCAGTWLLSLVTREHSWVDRLWSIVPVAYVCDLRVAGIAAEPMTPG